jgi:hypothetical protein
MITSMLAILMSVQQERTTVLHEVGLTLTSQNKDRPSSGTGLVRVKGTKIETDQGTLEIEGICKFEAGSLSCWTPDGKQHPSLATDVVEAIKMENPILNWKEPKLNKKNRLLVFKRSGITNLSEALIGQVAPEKKQPNAFKESWTAMGGAIATTRKMVGDHGMTERSVILGSFEPTTKAFPLRYQMESGLYHAGNRQPDNNTFPFQSKVVFRFGGNEIEIAAISDKPTKGIPVVGQRETLKDQEGCFVHLKVRSRKNLFQGISFYPLDEKGSVISRVDEKGNPVSNQQMSKMLDHGGVGFQGSSPADKVRGVNPILFDPGAVYVTQLDEYQHFFPMSASKIRNIGVTHSKRRIYEFARVRLEPK